MPTPRLALAAALLLFAPPALCQTTLPASDADWIVDGDQPTRTFGSHVAGAGDIDGDGYDDVLVGDAGFDTTLSDAGRILFYRGSAAGLSTTPAWILEGATAGANLYKAYAAGDVNGDGFADLIVQTAAGVSLYAGSVAGPTPTGWTAAGMSLGHGDLNGDGFDDIAAYSAPTISIFYGSASGLASAAATTVTLPPAVRAELLSGAIVKDLNGDRFDDLAFTWIFCSKNCEYLNSELRIHLGSGQGLVTQPKKILAFKDRYASVMPFVTSAGDVDGDGFGDLALTVRPDLALQGDPDSVYLIHGSKSGLRTTMDLVTQGPAGFLGHDSVGGAGDLDGDGFDDLFVPHGDSNVSPYRSLPIYGGVPAGLTSSPILIVEPEQAGKFPAIPAARAGDVNGDGLGDLLIGTPEYVSAGGQTGRAYVFYGRSSF